MKLSFSLFVMAGMMRSATGAFDCNKCDPTHSDYDESLDGDRFLGDVTTYVAFTEYAHAWHADKSGKQDIRCWDRLPSRFLNTFVGRNFDSEEKEKDLSCWDTSSVTDMQAMFAYTNFNGDVSAWDTTNVRSMYNMFGNNDFFNRDLSKWNVGKVTDFTLMFNNALQFVQSFDGWNASGGGNTITNMFLNSKCNDETAGLNPLDTSLWCDGVVNPVAAPTDAPGPGPAPAPAPAPALGRYEVAHRDVDGEVGKLLVMEPLTTDVYFEVGSSINDNTYLGLEVYGTLEVDGVTKACDVGQKIEDSSLKSSYIVLDGTSGTAGFELDLTTLAESFKAYNGAKVDICARVKYDNFIQTFVDTRIVIDRTYTADLLGTTAETIADPSSGLFNEDKETVVTVDEFFCNADKGDLGTGVEFGPGQDIRICVNPVQGATSLFLYKVNSFTGVKCTFAETNIDFDINFDNNFNNIETPDASGVGSFVFVLLDSELQKSTVKQLQCTGKAVISSTRKLERRLSSGSSNDNGLVRTLQETPEDVETTFSIGLTITDDDSGASSIASSTVAALAVGSLAAVLL